MLRKIFSSHLLTTLLSILVLFSIAFAGLTTYNTALLDTFLLAIDSNQNGSFSDETWFTELAARGANTDITSLGGLTTPLSGAQGGTGASTPAGARTNLGVSVAPWYTATVYVADDLVVNDGVIYRCLVGHTSGTDDEEPGTGGNWEDYWEAIPGRVDVVAGGAISANTDFAANTTHTMTVAGDFTMSVAWSPAAGRQFVEFVITGNATNTITWPTVLWAFGTAPTQPFAAKPQIIQFLSIDAGTTVYAFEVGVDMETP